MKFLFIVVFSGFAVLSAGHRGPHRNVDGGRKPVRLRKSGHRSPSCGQSSKSNRGWGGGWSGNSGEGWDGGVWNNNPIPFTWNTFKCIDPTKIIATPNIDLEFFTPNRNWYFTGATKYGAAIQFRMFKGRDPSSQDEINQVCPTVIFSLLGPKITVIRNGAGVQYQEECVGTPPLMCRTLLNPSTFDGKLGANPAAGFSKQENWGIATDNATFLILYTCYDDLYADFELFTTTPYVSSDLAKLYEDTAVRLGFPVTQLQLTVCKSRFTGWYPVPFQNYPNSPGNEGWSNGWNYHPAQNVLWSNGWNNFDNGWNNLNQEWTNGWSNGWGDNKL